MPVSGHQEAIPSIPIIPPLSPLPSVRTRPLDDPVMPANKRFRPSAHSKDVLYGPVASDGNPHAIAKAAMELIDGLHPSDVFSAQYAAGQPGVVSIRFRDQVKANHFVSAIEERPLLQGQTAVLAGVVQFRDGDTSGITGGQHTPSPLDIIRGVGKSSRRR